jgi:hypothetical protein
MPPRKAFPFGPSAKEFRAAFGVGASSKKIHPVDASGVMLASIQALHELILEEKADIQVLQREVRAARAAARKTTKKRR